MVKYKMILSKSIIISITLFIFGSVLLFGGISNKNHIKDCKPLDLIKFNEISSGDYVRGNIQSLLGKESSFDGKHLLFPFCNTDVWSQEEDYVACVNKVETKYIIMKVSSEFLADFKKSINSDLSSNYLLYGKVKKSNSYDTTIINSFKENLKGSDKIIFDEYVIEVVAFNKETEKIVQGIFVLLSGFLILIFDVKSGKLITLDNTQALDNQNLAIYNQKKNFAGNRMIRDIATLELLLAEEKFENEGLKNKYKAIKDRTVLNLVLSIVLIIIFSYIRFELIFLCLIYTFLVFLKSLFLLWINSNLISAAIISRKNSHESLKCLIFESDLKIAKYETLKKEFCERDL